MELLMNSRLARARSRGIFPALAFVAFFAAEPWSLQAAQNDAPLSANERMLLPGPQTERLERMTGAWDVVMTMRTSADAPPLVVKGIVAERTMVGQYLQEVMKLPPGAGGPGFTRISFLVYNRTDNRWEYS